jgi:hypothetical protein
MMNDTEATEVLKAIHEEYRERYIRDGYLDFNKDINDLMMKEMNYYPEKLASSVTVEGVKVGWYQDAKGSLYRYDGVIWDVVPKDKISGLEYLG